ncbi:alpha/beta fold hydrolase [Lentzea sp. BCCO 10_0856]|uniref:Alpha/beta fold hydrolase n=1 Tax=Lentzea miocenica TaxID=3095431 RepID=A0ABU4SZL9_9PSEU|nr:alpha/beta fold hydrolase [Lentzea sp. BCCO 10_0856]MDX8031333.1 alpha/beta fold hydrolase [Lentzea sp. BCCO 10_0856]
MYKRIKVTFESCGTTCAGYLYLPAAPAGRLPCVVLCHGFSGTMDRLFPHAERFAAEGMAALVFDYRGFGESAGEPRQLVDVEGQQEDLRSAIAFARHHDQVDSGAVVLWGNSLGGAHVISVAAGDVDVVAVVAQIPFNGFPKRVEERSTWQTLRLLGAIGWDALRGKAGLRPYYIPMVGRPGELAVAATVEAEQHIQALTSGEAASLWRNSVAPRALLGMMRYHPDEAAARLTMPLLVCVAADDRETPVETTRKLAERAPRGELRSYPGSHFTFYTDPATRERALTDQVGFFRRCLQLLED